MAIAGHYACSFCNRQLKEGEFMAVVGKTPPEALSMPLGRADTILKQVGKIYCEECFSKRYVKA